MISEMVTGEEDISTNNSSNEFKDWISFLKISPNLFQFDTWS